jgi:hypothetical protein
MPACGSHLVDDPGELRLGSCRQHHARSLAGEEPRRSRADAAACARDEDDLVS